MALHVIDGQSERDVIGLLERLLERARDGDIRSVLVLAGERDVRVHWYEAGRMNCPELVWAFESWKFDAVVQTKQEVDDDV